jgi:hypothetical protein
MESGPPDMVPLESLGFYVTSERVAIVILHVPTRE